MSTIGLETAASRGRNWTYWLGMLIRAAVGVSLVVLGLLALAKVSWHQAATNLTVGSWPVAEARIVSVSLEETRHPDARGATLINELELSVLYEYEVAGTFFYGHRASLADSAPPGDRRLQALYRKLDFARVTDHTVTASYDPDDPSQAYLDTDFAWRPAMLRVGFGIAMLLGGLAYVFYRRGPREQD